MAVKRTFDAAFLNRVANHPDVRPWIGGTGELDLSAVVAAPRNFALVTPAGGWVLAMHEPGTYELHTLMLPQGRGREHFRAGAEGLRYMFAATDAREIVTRVPVNNRAAVFSARYFGFRERFRRKDAWRGSDGVAHDVSFQALTLEDWYVRDSGCLEAGEVFHAQIEVAKAACGSALPDHPEDFAHDQAAGAAALMIGAGNSRKGVWFYNRWAALAGYAPIAVLSETPLVIDAGANVIVEVREGRMEVLQCP
jgi:hypothetical protein